MGSMDYRDTYKIEVALKINRAPIGREEKGAQFMSVGAYVEVLGHAPYTSYCCMTTRALAHKMIKQMHASTETDEDTYIRHLAMKSKAHSKILCYKYSLSFGV